MVLLGQTVAESVDFTVGMREAVGSHVGDASSKQDRFDTGLRVGCIVRAAPSVQSDSASAKACGSVIGDDEHSASGARHGELLPDLNLRRHCDHLYNTSTPS